MSTSSPAKHTLGAFVWRELQTRDLEAAKAFYGALFGWRFETAAMGPGFDYTTFALEGQQLGGMMDLAQLPHVPQEVPAHWGSYVSVPEVDEAAQRAELHGGQLCLAPQDIPGVGRYALVQDPWGATLHLFRDAHGDPADRPARVGEFCWENLSSPDPVASAGFYTQLLGWTTSAMGESTVFEWAGQAGPEGLASVGPSQDGSSCWTPFVKVASVEASLTQAQGLGGAVLLPRQVISAELGAFGILQDPTGAALFLFEDARPA